MVAFLTKYYNFWANFKTSFSLRYTDVQKKKHFFVKKKPDSRIRGKVSVHLIGPPIPFSAIANFRDYPYSDASFENVEKGKTI